MKRSEMIEIMQDAGREWYDRYSGNPDGYTYQHHILKRMEEAGMLPPTWSTERDPDFGTTYEWNTWEEE